MYFRHRYNCIYRDLPACASPGVMVSVVSAGGELSDPVPWLGSVDRVIARHVSGVEQVILDIEGWRLSELDPTTWLPAGEYVVGAQVQEGVFVVTDGRKPLIKRTRDGGNGKPDRLGRLRQ
ncbi:hypothetical protein [Marinobacter subterrani]|uniref:hypothetical protein n=1 Tax=Marinobacter subterrani TaxID=1658765 RepID=UPI002353EBDD|nr:hypothetical protein [Marinobacter subterrani]